MLVGGSAAAAASAEAVLTSMRKAEDAAHSSGDYGMMGLGVRKDYPGTLAGADLDYAPMQFDADGWQRVVAKGAGVPGLGAEQYGGFPVGGRAASSDRSALGVTEFGCVTMSLLAKLINLPYALPGMTWQAVLTFAAASHASTAIKAAGGSGVRHYVTSIVIADVGGAAWPTGTYVEIKDGTTVVAVGTIGQVLHFPVPLRFSDNTAINIDPSAGVDIKVTAVGFSAGE